MSGGGGRRIQILEISPCDLNERANGTIFSRAVMVNIGVNKKDRKTKR
ncbi:MAG: hypothetical protein II921_04180 [Treponema sp.]|nr:hypothetical protein [Treponema sp.]